MKRSTRRTAKVCSIAAMLPLLVYAYEYGPDAGVAGVPGEAGTCNQSGCHTGTGVNGGGGSVTVTFPNGMTYTPGATQHLVVTITDAIMKRWGFELTARTQTDTTQMAGSFSPTDQYTQLMCDPQADLGIWSSEQNSTTSCPAGQLTYVEHTLAGYQRNQSNPGQYQFDWVPPATDVGPVTIYVAANAGPGGLPSNLGCHIYTATYTLTTGSTSTQPTIASIKGVVAASDWGSYNAIAPGSWMEIHGSNLAQKPDVWNASASSAAPTQMDGVSVSIGGQAAPLWYLQPNQLNVLVPASVPGGMQQVIVTTPLGASAPYSVMVNATQAALMAPAAFNIGGKQYVAGYLSDGSWALPAGSIPGVATRPAKAGETVTLYGIGFGPFKTDPAGVVMNVPSTIQFKFGNTAAAQATVFGLPQNFCELYQFGVVLPAVKTNDAVPLNFAVGGKAGAQTLFIAVQ